MIQLKNDGERARARGVTPEIVLAITIAGEIFTTMTNGRNMVITSLGELGDFRKKGSRHLSGNAFDIRTRGMEVPLQQQISGDIRDALGPDYDVVLESNHIHVEYDPTPA